MSIVGPSGTAKVRGVEDRVRRIIGLKDIVQGNHPEGYGFSCMARSEPSLAIVVDDDTLIRMDAIDILEDAGFEVLDAPDVDHALGLLAEHHPRVTLLFTDVHMPGEHDGFHLSREVARCWPHISIVVASGRAQPGPGDLPPGATFIAKPFSAQVVHDRLRETMPEHAKPEPLRNCPST